MYDKCPDSSDQLLNYLNNHNGGVLQNAVPTGKQHVLIIINPILHFLIRDSFFTRDGSLTIQVFP